MPTTTTEILSAVVTQVPFGGIELEGLLLNTDEYAIAISQLSVLNLVPPNRSQKQLEALLGFNFQSHRKAKTRINPKAVNIISLVELERVIVELAIKGNPRAIELTRMLIGLSLIQLFADAFGQKFEKEERQDFLKNRQATKDSFWWFVPEIDEWIQEHGSSNPQAHYINAFKAMSVGLFGKEPNVIKSELGISKGELNRDHFGNEALIRIDGIQRLARVKLQKGFRPMQAVKEAIADFDYAIISYLD